jgi:sugar phosphate isomerase/epimerase
MYKILNTRGLGIGGRQNELIELALTYKFDGVEIDMEDLLGRHDALGKEFACQFLKSAKKLDMGTFRLPINFGSSEDAFKKAVGKIETILSLASELGAKRCFVELETNSPTDSFQENFDTHKTRLAEVAEIFATHDIKIGVYLNAVGATDVEGQFKFIQTAEEVQTLVKSVGHDHLGVCLDMFEWQAGGGTVDQVKALLASNAITEVRLADVKEGADANALTKADRVPVPGSEVGSVSWQVVQLLNAAGYDGAISASTDTASFSADGRDPVLEKISTALDQLAEGLDPAVVAAETAAAAAAEAAEEAGEGDEAGAETATGEAAQPAAAQS